MRLRLALIALLSVAACSEVAGPRTQMTRPDPAEPAGLQDSAIPGAAADEAAIFAAAGAALAKPGEAFQLTIMGVAQSPDAVIVDYVSESGTHLRFRFVKTAGHWQKAEQLPVSAAQDVSVGRPRQPGLHVQSESPTAAVADVFRRSPAGLPALPPIVLYNTATAPDIVQAWTISKNCTVDFWGNLHCTTGNILGGSFYGFQNVPAGGYLWSAPFDSNTHWDFYKDNGATQCGSAVYQATVSSAYICGVSTLPDKVVLTYTLVAPGWTPQPNPEPPPAPTNVSVTLQGGVLFSVSYDLPDPESTGSVMMRDGTTGGQWLAADYYDGYWHVEYVGQWEIGVIACKGGAPCSEVTSAGFFTFR